MCKKSLHYRAIALFSHDFFTNGLINNIFDYNYDVSDRLIEVKTEAGATSNYTYDILSNLTEVTLLGDMTINYNTDAQCNR